MTVNSTPTPGAAAHMHIRLDALVRNYQTLAKAGGNAVCSGVVKANAYGLGVEPVSKALWQAGCHTFFVALLSEAIELRAILPDATLYVLGGLLPDTAPACDQYTLRPVLGSMEEITEWSGYCQSKGVRLPAAVHIDTGINRLGLDYEDGLALLQSPTALEGFDLCLLMSHLACADEPLHRLNRAQIEKSAHLQSLQPDVPFSLANSAGILGSPDTHFNLTRPGIALYGGNPFAAVGKALEQVFTLEAPVLQVRDVAPGQTIGYSGTYRCNRPSKIAILGVGYADGYFRSLSSNPNNRTVARVWVCGQKAPVIGRVSMDMIGIDVTDIAQTEVTRGTMVELIGDNIRLDDIALLANSFSYELLTRLGNRFERVYSHNAQ